MRQTTVKRHKWMLCFVGAIVVLGAVSFAVRSANRRPDMMAVKMKFKQQLDALDG